MTTDQTTQLQQNTNNMKRSQCYDEFIDEFSFLFKKKAQSLHDTIHDIITDSSKNIEDIKKKIITTLHSGTDINKANPEGKAPVMYLLEKAKELKGKYQGTLKQAARFLIERGASLNGGIAEGFMTQEERDSIHQSRHALQEKAKGELGNYIEKGVIKEVSIYGNCAQIQLENDDDTKEFQISELLNSDFCKDNGISGFSTLHKNGVSGMHGAVHNNIRHYVVTDGSYAMNLKWWVEGKECEITIKIDADGSVALTEGNGVTWEQLEAHKDVKLGDLFLADALREGRWKDGLQQSKETIRSVELQQGQSEETVISVGRGIEANNEKSKTHFGHKKGPAPQPPKVSSWGEASNSEYNVKTSTPNSHNTPSPNFNASPVPFYEKSSNQVPTHNLGILTDDYCEETGKRTITYNDGSIAVIEDVPDERDSVAAQAQKQPTLLAITYPDDDKKSNTQSSNSLEDDKFASTTTKSTINSSPYFSSLPPVNSFKPKQPPSIHTQQQQKAQDEEVLNEFDPLRNNNVEKTTELTESEFPSDELQSDSGFSSPTHTGKRTVQMDHESVVKELSGLEKSTSGVSLKHVDTNDLRPRTERRLSEGGLREEYSINANGRTEIFNSNNWPIRSGSNKSESQIDPERLKNVAMMLVGLKEPDYNDAELSTEENASISSNQGSEQELEYDSSLDGNDEFEERDTALLRKASSLPNLSNLNRYGSVGVLRNDKGFIDDELTDDACTKLVSHEKKEDEFLKIVDDAVDDAKARINGIEKNEQDYHISFPKKYGQTHGKTIKPSNPSLHQKIQSKLKERFNQPNKGLKRVEETAKEVSPPAKKDYHPLLRQTREGLKTVEETAKEASSTAKDYNLFLRQAREGLKKLEPLPREIQRVNTNNQHLGYTETKQLWEKRISQELQEKQEKQQRKHEERGVLRSYPNYGLTNEERVGNRGLFRL